jgi:hypothetical protein
MKKHTFVLIGLVAALAVPGLAQNGPGPNAAPLPAVETPPRAFATAEEHYQFLLQQANGGTRHTLQTIPQWPGLWTSGRNSMVDLFLDGGRGAGLGPGGKVRPGVLTPAYEAHFSKRREEVEKNGEQLFDRLANCEYPGVPRWLWEPYVKEFVNLPEQSWMLNDFMNEGRRVYIGKEHVNFEAKHSSTGDSIGFWQGDELVIWTKWVNPADYTRGMPLTSNQFEMVERWRQVENAEGRRQLITQVTFYDPIGLVAPQSAVYVHNHAPELEEAGVRVRNWECTTSTNTYKDAEGRTQSRLPGEPGYKDPRGSTEFADLPGQSLDPILEAQAAE